MELKSPETHSREFRKQHPGLASSGSASLERFTHAVTSGREFIERNPSASNLFQETSSVTESDTYEAKNLLQNFEPVTIDNYQTYLQVHTTSRVAELLAISLKQSDPDTYMDLNPHLVKVVALLQGTKDILRLGKFHRRDITGRLVLQKLGIQRGILKHIPSTAQFINKTPEESLINQTIAESSLESQIVAIASMIGQRSFDEDGIHRGIKNFDDALLEYKTTLQRLSQPSIPQDSNTYQALALAKYVEDWPSEQYSLTPQTIDFIVQYYTVLQRNFAEKGINFATIPRQILDAESNAPIQGIIFDIGGLAQESPKGQPVIAALSRMLEIDPDIIEKDWGKLSDLYGIGFHSIESFWSAVYARFGRRPPTQEDITLLNGIHADSINASMDPQMKQVILDTKNKGYIAAAHTLTGPPHLAKNRAGDIFNEFDLVRTSCDTHSGKEIPSSHLIIPIQTDLPPRSFIFIDDNSTYLEAARKVGIRTVLHVPGHDMRAELNSAGASL